MKTIEEITQSYYEFLDNHRAKEKLKEIIEDGLENWKQNTAYEWFPGANRYDYSGELKPVIVDGCIQRICDVHKTDVDILQAYSGNRVLTLCNCWKVYYLTVADELSDEINECLYDFRSKWANEHCDELMVGHEQDYKDKKWNNEQICDYVDYVYFRDESLNYDWMFENFPEYLVSNKPDNEFYRERPEVPFNVYS